MFISRKLNGRGQIFDFVRFKEVVNEVELEKRLGEVSIGNMKSHINQNTRVLKITQTTRKNMKG